MVLLQCPTSIGRADLQATTEAATKRETPVRERTSGKA